MVVYLFLAFFFFLCYFLPLKASQRKGVYVALFFILVLFDGLRWENGTDWQAYYDMFSNPTLDRYNHIEPAYMEVNRIIRAITSEYTVFLIVHALFLYSVLFSFFKKYSVYPLLSVFLFFTGFLGYQGMNRQYIALAICIIGIPFLLKNQKWKFVLLVITASFFHYSAFLFLVALLCKKLFSVKVYVLFLVVAIVLAQSNFVSFITDIGMSLVFGNIASYFEAYTEYGWEGTTGSMIIIGYFKRLIVIIPFLLVIKKRTELLTAESVLFFNLYFVGVLLYILFNGTSMQIIVGRGVVYFAFFEFVLSPLLVKLYEKRFGKRLLLCLLGVYFFINMITGIHRYDVGNQNPFLPYKSIYYNTNVVKPTD